MTANTPRVLKAGCSVRDDGRPGPCGLDISEHRLSADGEWIHPVGQDAHTGYFIWDEDDERTEG